MKILFFKTKSGSVSCKLELPYSGFRYRKGTSRNIRTNRDSDSSLYPLAVGFNIVDDFLCINDIKNDDIEVDPQSLNTFYGYDGYGDTRTVATLTRGFVNDWWNRDCPMLFRYTPNKDDSRSILGMKLPCFSRSLVETSFTGTYIDETITEEEVRLLTRDREHTTIYKEMQNVLAVATVTPEALHDTEKYVADYEAKVQQAINNNNVHIVSHLFAAGMFDENGKERCFGLDCGFINVYTKNPEYAQKKSILKNAKRVPEWMGIRFPYQTQSLTVMEKEFEKIKEVVLAETGETLYCKTFLD